MVDIEKFAKFNSSGIEKQLVITVTSEFGGTVYGKLTNSDLHSQQFELIESICSGNELRFGGCESSCVKFRVNNDEGQNTIFPLKGKRIVVQMFLDDDVTPLELGEYVVDSDKATADRRYRDIVAYDSMKKVINKEYVTNWYNTFEQSEERTVYNLRKAFGLFCGYPQDNVELPNDNVAIPFDYGNKAENLSGHDVLMSIAEINGCFAKIGRDGKMHYIFVQPKLQSIYPSNFTFPSNQTFPNQYINRITRNHYKTCSYEDFTSKRITRIQVLRDGEDATSTSGVIYPNPTEEIKSTDNVYRIQNNLLLRHADDDTILTIIKNMWDKIKDIEYMPFQVQSNGNPCFEAGDYIVIPTRYKEIKTYIFSRTLKGIQALFDNYSAKGVETYANINDSVSNGSRSVSGAFSTTGSIEGDDRVSELEKEIAEMKSKVDTISKSMDGLRATLEKLSSKINESLD